MIELGDIAKNTVVVIAGPTASGKSKLAFEMAKKYDGVIINADASQVYKGIPIISAAPDENDKKEVLHMLYEIFEPEHNGSVSEWLKLAVEAIKKVWKQDKLPIVVGGTGFYIESLIAGISPIPETKREVKNQVADKLQSDGVEELYEYLKTLDPKGAAMVNPRDVARVRRALEIFCDTGISIAQWFEKPLIKKLPEAEFTVIALLPKLSELEDKCNTRFDKMINCGALHEVENLYKMELRSDLPVMKAIGVTELGGYLKGENTLDEAIKLSKLHTRQYAKRQLTWFRNRLIKMCEKTVVLGCEQNN